MAHAVSVCHQWSITGTLSKSAAQLQVSGSNRSPARKRVSNMEMSYFLRYSPPGSSLLIALMAVGAVKRAFTRCSEITLQNAPGSGVPTGFPSNTMVVAPRNSGAYTIYEWPTTHPTSDAANTRPGADVVDVFHAPHQCHRVTAVVPHHTLGFAGGSGRKRMYRGSVASTDTHSAGAAFDSSSDQSRSRPGFRSAFS